jgi:hypothetical protein
MSVDYGVRDVSGLYPQPIDMNELAVGGCCKKVAESSIDVNYFILMIYYLDIYIRYIIIYLIRSCGLDS